MKSVVENCLVASCLEPSRIVNPYTHEVMVVPCGHCRACMMNKASRYSLQCKLEALYSDSLFVGLSYSNQNVPLVVPVQTGEYVYDLYDVDTGELLEHYTYESWKQRASFHSILSKFNLSGYVPYLRKKDLQDYIKRVRFHVWKKFKIKVRHYSVGEYGPKTFRPHYHVIFFLPKGHESKRPELFKILRSCWQYGIVSAEVSRGQCANYVASYVNSNYYVPEILKLPTFRPFTVHSQFLGRAFCEGQRQKAYSCSAKEFVSRSFVSDGRLTAFRLWRSYYNVFFPKCKGFASKLSHEREYSYRLYGIARQLFPQVKTPLRIAHEVARCLLSPGDVQKVIEINLHNAHYDGIDSYVFSLKTLIDYFYGSLNVDFTFISYGSDDYNSLVLKIYHEFLISRHFLQFVCDGKTDDKTIRYYLGKIENFYSELDYMHLTEFLSSQSVYMDSDFADEHDLDFMYHNSLISSSFEKSSLFKKFKFQKHKEFNDRIKHKKLNDSNLFFIYNDCDYEKEIES